MGVVLGCIQVDRFECQDDTDCVFEGQPGQCRLAEQTCIYPDLACETQWSAASGECMPPAAEATTTTGALTSDSTSEDTGGEPQTGGSDGDTTAGIVPCRGDDELVQNITAQGNVSASSTFDDGGIGGFVPSQAVDDDYGTSWFSAGVDLRGMPSLYEWTSMEPRCITRVSFTGNGQHADPIYRENYGYASMVMRVYDADDEVVFQQMFNLAGTPDPDTVAEIVVVGVRVELELIDHESFNCGGFSELQIDGY